MSKKGVGAMQDYLAAMSCAANYAWVNRSTMTFLVRQAFAKQFKKTPVHLTVACPWKHCSTLIHDAPGSDVRCSGRHKKHLKAASGQEAVQAPQAARCHVHASLSKDEIAQKPYMSDDANTKKLQVALDMHLVYDVSHNIAKVWGPI